MLVFRRFLRKKIPVAEHKGKNNGTYKVVRRMLLKLEIPPFGMDESMTLRKINQTRTSQKASII